MLYPAAKCDRAHGMCWRAYGDCRCGKVEDSMVIPVIVLPFREVNDYEYPSLQQRMDDDYVHAFAPYLVAVQADGMNSVTPISC